MSQTAAVQTALSEFDTPQAWYGPELAQRTDWIHDLGDADRQELRHAIAVARASGQPLHSLGRAQFPLVSLAARLNRLRREALDGRGFFLLRGVPVAEYSPWESAVAFWGIGLYLGEAVSQNGKGHVLGHVANLGLDYADPEVRGYQTNAGLNFHTDFSDLVGLLSLRTPQSGGLSKIASSTTIWNEMVAPPSGLGARSAGTRLLHPLGRGRCLHEAVLRHAGVLSLRRTDGGHLRTKCHT